MPNLNEAVMTPWEVGRLDGRRGAARLLFRRTFEDWTVELAAFRAQSRILCIASGGCTAIALANAGHDVSAVDINPVQIQHVQGRLKGIESRRSASELLLRAGRRLLPLMGFSRATILNFLTTSSIETQVDIWDRLWRPRAVMAARLLLHPSVLRLVYDPRFVEALPPQFGAALAERFRRGLSLHANSDNPFVWQLFLGKRPSRLDPVPDRPERISLHVGDVVDFLESRPAGSFDGFSLSNILDGCNSAYRRRLAGAVRRAAARGAHAMLRTFGNVAAPETDWRALDRSHLWGSVAVYRVSADVASEDCFGIAVPAPSLEKANAQAA